MFTREYEVIDIGGAEVTIDTETQEIVDCVTYEDEPVFLEA